MAYCLKAGQPVGAELRRIVLEEIDSAQKRLTEPKVEDRDKSVHEARKSIKKLRGLLRLIEPALGRHYKKTDHRLRDIGRELSKLRDTRAIIDTFETVVKETEAQAVFDTQVVQSIRDRLQAHKTQTEQDMVVAEVFDSAVNSLKKLREHANGYPFHFAGFESLEPGFKEIYRRGRKAMIQAERTPTPEAFHTWRKRVKDHWYHVRLLSQMDVTFLRTREDDLRKLETWLGEDHNLMVLSETIHQHRDSLEHHKHIQHLLSVTKQHGKQLRSKAILLGKILYDLKPKRFLGEFAKAREIWPSDAPAEQNLCVLSTTSKLQPAPTQAGVRSSKTKQLKKQPGTAQPYRVRARTKV